MPHSPYTYAGASIHMGQGEDMKGGTSMVMCPNIWWFIFPVTATTVDCRILMQIKYIARSASLPSGLYYVYFHKKIFSFWGTNSRPPTEALPLDPAGGLPSPSLLLCPPNNPVRSTPLLICHCPPSYSSIECMVPWAHPTSDIGYAVLLRI